MSLTWIFLSSRNLTNHRDRHYLNDEGDCVACSEFKGLWPDDDSEHDDYEPVEEYAGATVDRPEG